MGCNAGCGRSWHEASVLAEHRLGVLNLISRHLRSLALAVDERSYLVFADSDDCVVHQTTCRIVRHMYDCEYSYRDSYVINVFPFLFLRLLNSEGAGVL